MPGVLCILESSYYYNCNNIRNNNCNNNLIISVLNLIFREIASIFAADIQLYLGIEIKNGFLYMAKYDKKIVKRICDLIAKDSYTIREICSQVGISVETFYEWRRTKPDFSDSIKKAKCEFDDFIASEAKNSLVKLIRGYTVQEKKTVTVDTGKADDDGNPIMKVKEHSVTDKHYQPVTAAVIFALTNRDSENWKNRQNTDVTSDGERLGITPTEIIFKRYDGEDHTEGE
jgi:hypothetical protein